MISKVNLRRILITATVLSTSSGVIFCDLIPVRYRSDDRNISAYKKYNYTNIPFLTVFNYTQILEAQKSKEFIENMGIACYHEDQTTAGNYDVFNLVTLRNPKIRHFKVLNAFDSTIRNVSVEFFTTWDKIENATFSDLVNAINLNGLLRVLLKVNNDPDSVGNPSANATYATDCENKEYYTTPRLWCNSSALYKDKIIEGGAFFLNNQCVIDSEVQGRHNILLWKASPGDGVYRKQCVVANQEDVSYDKWKSTNLRNKYALNFTCTPDGSCLQSYKKIGFKTNGKGIVKKLVVGNSISDDSIDLNFTVTFQRWTYQFVEVFCNSFTFCDFPIDDTTLELKVHMAEVKPPPAEKVPEDFVIWMLFMTAPAFMIVTSLLFCILTRSNKGFVPTVWEYWKKKKAMEAMKSKDALSAI